MSELSSLGQEITVSPQGIVSPPTQLSRIKLVADSSHPEWGNFCFYHPTNPRSYGEPLVDQHGNSALLCTIVDLFVSYDGKAGSKGSTTWKGKRAYVIAILQTPMPNLRYQLAMPTTSAGYVYRSFLAHTSMVDLCNKYVILQGKQGKRDATFCQFFMDDQLVRLPDGLIPAGSAEMEKAINRSRINLGLPPQFETISDTVDV
tara:strand:- start:1836 stop:2444 length:609 start_codon:yes stop_codon:yes gene_type:complete